MTQRHLPRRGQLRKLRAAASISIAAALLFATAVPAVAAWEVAHGDPANSGFANVDTAPAGAGSRSVPGLGTIARGAAPVTAPDGTVYIGTLEGRVVALRADGCPYWNREILPAGQSIVASPAVASDGSVFVVGVRLVGEGAESRFETRLHRFVNGGGYPQAGVPFPGDYDGIVTSAAPNIWRFNGSEAVIVPALYANRLTGGHELRLVAFSTSGGYLADTRVSTFVPEVTGGSGLSSLRWAFCVLPVPLINWLNCLPEGFSLSGPPSPRALPRMAGVAIYTYPGGGTPHIVVSDNEHGLFGYTLSTGGGFIKSFQVEDRKRLMRSPPVVAPEAYSMVGQQDLGRDSDGFPALRASGAIIFGGPSGRAPAPLTGLGPVLAPPTRTIHGLFVALEAGRGLAILRENQLLARVPLPGATDAAAAASRTHLFVATPDALVTFDSAGQAVLAEFPWVGGGAQRPVIGPQGHVYAIASNILFVFPPPKSQPAPAMAVLQDLSVLDTAATAEPAPAATAPPPAPALAASLQRYKEPKGPSGLRLYACTVVGGSTCERPVALTFCQGQGFAAVGKYDTDEKKARAETLTGEVCTKKRCKVFNYIDCRN